MRRILTVHRDGHFTVIAAHAVPRNAGQTVEARHAVRLRNVVIPAHVEIVCRGHLSWVPARGRAQFRVAHIGANLRQFRSFSRGEWRPRAIKVPLF